MILKIFLFWRLGLFALTYFASLIFPLNANTGIGAIGPFKQFDYWKSMAQWDGGHYWNIATFGYRSLENFAFFPLYPVIIKTLSPLFLANTLLTGLLISNIAFLLFLFFFHKLISAKYGKKIAFDATVTFIFFPTAFFAVSYYSESLFLLFVTLTFFCFSKKSYIFTAIFSSLAGLTRFVAIFLPLSLTFGYFSRINFNFKKVDKNFLWLILTFSGFATYIAYFAAQSVNPLVFLKAQSYWARYVTDPSSTLFSYFWAIVTFSPRPAIDYLDFALTIIALVLLGAYAFKISSSLWIFSMLTILIAVSSGTLTSMSRYLLSAIGAFIAAGIFFQKRRNLKIAWWTFSLALQVILAIRFINGFWVA